MQAFFQGRLGARYKKLWISFIQERLRNGLGRSGSLAGLPDYPDEVGANLLAHEVSVDAGIALFPELGPDFFDVGQLLGKLEGPLDDSGLAHRVRVVGQRTASGVPWSFTSAICAA